jgi:hypothetical protein
VEDGCRGRDGERSDVFYSQTDVIHVLHGYHRPDKNSRRTQYGCKRLCMPPVPTDIFIDAIKSAVLANANWVPPHGQGSLYLRPLIIGTGPIRRPPRPHPSPLCPVPCALRTLRYTFSNLKHMSPPFPSPRPLTLSANPFTLNPKDVFPDPQF